MHFTKNSVTTLEAKINERMRKDKLAVDDTFEGVYKQMKGIREELCNKVDILKD
jgi:hypothetical protein